MWFIIIYKTPNKHIFYIPPVKLDENSVKFEDAKKCLRSADSTKIQPESTDVPARDWTTSKICKTLLGPSLTTLNSNWPEPLSILSRINGVNFEASSVRSVSSSVTKQSRSRLLRNSFLFPKHKIPFLKCQVWILLRLE